ncbi:hypothetical protein DOT_4851 [Desulfosporosinus sp. OT]|nr:hypothetical protein DOT_4851 [Desulfosporosinus sp. OT]
MIIVLTNNSMLLRTLYGVSAAVSNGENDIGYFYKTALLPQ